MKHAENEILELFISESSDLLKSWESFSLELERNQEAGILGELFRIAHSLKGFSLNAGLKEISKLVHQVEEFVLALRDQKISCDLQAVDILLDFKDLLDNWIYEIRYDKNYVSDYKVLSNRISDILQEASESNVVEKSAPAILLVDRKDQFTQLVKCLLDYKYEVILSHSNSEAEKAFNENDPVLVVVEVRAANINGIQFIQEIRKTSSIPIVAYSKLFANEFPKARAAGANTTLQKDDNVSQITIAVEKLLKS
ncbi:MAG: Hpt domain-containing protein [Oligoflexales bacterium]